MNIQDFYKIDTVLPPVKEPIYAKKIPPSTLSKIVINFPGRAEISNSPKHIRLPKPKQDPENRYFTRSQLAYTDKKLEKILKLRQSPQDEDYFVQKIQKTVKKQFHMRRVSMGNNFNVVEYMKEPRVHEGLKSEMKNHKVVIELDPGCDVGDKTGWNKRISSKILPKLQVAGSEKDEGEGAKNKNVGEELKKGIEENRSNNDGPRKRKIRFISIGKNGFAPKVDQGLQTEEPNSSESRKRFE